MTRLDARKTHISITPQITLVICLQAYTTIWVTDAGIPTVHIYYQLCILPYLRL